MGESDELVTEKPAGLRVFAWPLLMGHPVPLKVPPIERRGGRSEVDIRQQLLKTNIVPATHTERERERKERERGRERERETQC